MNFVYAKVSVFVGTIAAISGYVPQELVFSDVESLPSSTDMEFGVGVINRR
jgi:hypothetical protein